MRRPDTDRVRPWPPPPRIGRRRAELQRLLGARLDAAALAKAAHALAAVLGEPAGMRLVALYACAAKQPPDSAVTVALSHANLGRAWLRLEAPLAVDCVARLLGMEEMPAARPLTAAERGALAYLVLRVIEGAPGWRVGAVSQAPPDDPEEAAWADLDVVIGRHRHAAGLAVDEATLLRLPSAPPQWARASRLHAVFVDAPVVAGSALLPAAEVRALLPGDVLVLEPSPHRAELRVGGGGFPLDVQPEGSRVAGPFELRGERMDKTDLVQSIPVELVAEIGRLRLTGKELLDLEPGAVLPLGRPTAAPVDLTCAGRLVARGELVDIEGEAGVRLTELLP